MYARLLKSTLNAHIYILHVYTSLLQREIWLLILIKSIILNTLLKKN